MMNKSITIAQIGVPIIEYKGRRAITLTLIDQLHGRVNGTASRNFTRNKAKLIEGEDYDILSVSLKDEFRCLEIPNRGLTILYETGYLMLVKSLNDDLAWQIQRELINKYFTGEREKTQDIVETFQAYTIIGECIGLTGNQLALAANTATIKHTGINALENMGLSTLEAEVQEQTLTATDIAKRLNIKPRQVNPLLIEKGLQTAHRDHKDRLYYELTEMGKKHGIYIDTGKKHKTDGSPIRQIKWYNSIIEILKTDANFKLII